MDASGGVTRLSLSSSELQGRAYIKQLMREAGLDVSEDAAGNIIGRLHGERPQEAVVMTGSHIDTVIHAGRFDGALGVLGGIEALRAIKEHGMSHARTLEVVCFTDEEGVRFGVGYLGSRAMAGDWKPEWLSETDAEGITLAEAMKAAGLQPEKVHSAARSGSDIHAYVELHIEQGRVLEHHQLPVGIASALFGHRWLEISLKGQADHAGTTPMPLRHDALSAAAETIMAVERIALEHGGVATVGTLRMVPGAINVIAGEVIFSVDLRHEDASILDAMALKIEQAAFSHKDSRGVSATVRVTDGDEPVTASGMVMEAIEGASGIADVGAMSMVCGAGHDAVAINALTGIGLILIRSREGISHHPAEWSSPEDCAAGAEVLLHTLVALANGQ